MGHRRSCDSTQHSLCALCSFRLPPSVSLIQTTGIGNPPDRRHDECEWQCIGNNANNVRINTRSFCVYLFICLQSQSAEPINHSLAARFLGSTKELLRATSSY